MADVVLDASAVLAHLRAERGGEQVAEAMVGAWLCSVNVTEVVQKLLDIGAPEKMVVGTIEGLPCRVEAFDEALALQAGILRRLTRSAGLSLGDRACLALALRERVPVLTADRAWAALDLGVEVVLIR